MIKTMGNGLFPNLMFCCPPRLKGRKMIDTELRIHIKTDKSGENIDFFYNRKDNIKIEEKNEQLLVMAAEQLVRGVLDNGFGFVDKKDVKHGEDVSK